MAVSAAGAGPGSPEEIRAEMEQDRDFTEKVWAEEVRLDEEYEDWVAEVGEEEAAAYAEFIAKGGDPEDWGPGDEDEEEDVDQAWGTISATVLSVLCCARQYCILCLDLRFIAITTGVLQRGRDQVNGSWAPTETEAYEAQMAMYQAMAMAQQQTRQGQAGNSTPFAGAASQGGAPMGRWLAVLTAAWLAKDVATHVFRARL